MVDSRHGIGATDRPRQRTKTHRTILFSETLQFFTVLMPWIRYPRTCLRSNLWRLNINTRMDEDKISALFLRDLSAAFDTIDHQSLLSRVGTVFGIRSTAHQWFRSYFLDRNQCIIVNKAASFSSRMFVATTGLNARCCTICFVHYSTVRRHSQSLSQTLAFWRRHPDLKFNSTKWRTKPYTWPAVMSRG